MSTFATAMASAWDPAVSVFGDTIVFFDDVLAVAYNCIIHDLQLSTEVNNPRPGRVAVLSGQVVMKATDWVLAAGAKGSRVVVGGADARVLNDPDIGYSGDTVTLVLGPRT